MLRLRVFIFKGEIISISTPDRLSRKINYKIDIWRNTGEEDNYKIDGIWRTISTRYGIWWRKKSHQINIFNLEEEDLYFYKNR